MGSVRESLHYRVQPRGDHIHNLLARFGNRIGKGGIAWRGIESMDNRGIHGILLKV
jgi:hypothetical protein